ncbi:PAS domain S-box protein [Methanoculleus sp. Wushi-C6]|uniref:PAS domain S-box protein n=1 Tax=Methanoculleus caldifontis TaxID=2651577 RepID=A0ABU3WZZ1_9EURY|nr:methyl-accepting chemotaxis protein [Methanoculleus sp. Wushi-C6]MDV2481358.1 PAS domain S-box protein [Methanoculleus sp. Wushi-C6]
MQRDNRETTETGEFYRALYESVPVALLLIDDNRIIECNRAAEALFDCGGRENLIGLDPARLSPGMQPDGSASADLAARHLREALSGRRTFEWVHRRAGDGTFTAEVTLTPADTGSGLKILAAVRDISEEKEVRKQAEEAGHRADAILQENPIPTIIWDRSLHVKAVNEAFLKITGYDRKRVESMTLKDFSHVGSQSGQEVAEAFRTKQATSAELAVAFPHGTFSFIRYSVPLPDRAGNVESVMAVYKDITDQKEQLEQMRVIQQQADAIVQENPMPILLWKTDLTVEVVNKAFRRLSGFSDEQCARLTVRDFKYLSQSGEGVADTVKSHRASKGEAAIEFPAGIRILERYNIPLLDRAGDLANVLTVYNDITEKRSLDERLRKSIDELAASLHAVAAGDLTKLAVTYPDDPLAAVKGSMNETIAALTDLLRHLLEQADALEHAIIDVGKGADEIARASQQVANTAQKSSDGAKEQIRQLDRVTKKVGDLSASVEEIASTAQEVRDRALNVAKAGEFAVGIGNEAGEKMQAVQKISERAVEEITNLNAKMQDISHIVKLITDIANQTNLLALNAAIEAARAGEHGRGFAVVAGEVRNLAGESKSATRQIEEVIGGVTASSRKTAEAMQGAHAEILGGIESVNKTIEALNRMVADVGVAVNGIADISRATESQADETTSVTTSIEEVFVLVQDNEKGMESLAALAEESSASTEEVASASNEIRQMAHQLREKVATFRFE